MSKTQGLQFLAATPEEDAAIKKIVDCVYTLPLTFHPARVQLTMDLTLCHNQGTKLDLEGLLAADDRDFMHDVMGVRAHIDRSTGKLLDRFAPRYAAPLATTPSTV